MSPDGFDVLARSAGAGDALALAGPERTWTFAELRAAVGVRTEEVRASGAVGLVPFVARADAETVIELLALWRAGRVPVPLNARLTEAERERARSRLAGVEAPPGASVVLWTSGTSGSPRGVALSTGNLIAITRASAERLALAADDVWLGSLSPAHVGGLVLVVRSLLLGGTLVVPGDPGTEGIASALDGGVGTPTPTHLSLVPTQLRRLLEMRGDGPAPEGLRCVLIGGAHAPAALVARAVDAGWPIALTYGATEMSSQIATAPPEAVRAAPGTVGRPMPGVEVRIAEDGEILARGPTRALGYVAGSSGGEAAGLASLADAEGWYHTGDLGSVDEAGRLRVTGRRIDRIVSGGVTIDAHEVEEAVRGHPAVADVCVVGIADETWGERVAALIVPVEGEFDPDVLEEDLRERLMSAKRPRAWRLAAELPRNANGKVDRAAARELLSEGGSPRRP